MSVTITSVIPCSGSKLVVRPFPDRDAIIKVAKALNERNVSLSGAQRQACEEIAAGLDITNNRRALIAPLCNEFYHTIN